MCGVSVLVGGGYICGVCDLNSIVQLFGDAHMLLDLDACQAYTLIWSVPKLSYNTILFNWMPLFHVVVGAAALSPLPVPFPHSLSTSMVVKKIHVF